MPDAHMARIAGVAVVEVVLEAEGAGDGEVERAVAAASRSALRFLALQPGPPRITSGRSQGARDSMSPSAAMSASEGAASDGLAAWARDATSTVLAKACPRAGRQDRPRPPRGADERRG